MDAAGTRVDRALASGQALERFARMVSALGGAGDFVAQAATRLPSAPVERALPAPRSGWVQRVATRDIGLASIELGGGRHKAEDTVDPRVGLWNPPYEKIDEVCRGQSAAFLRVASIGNESPLDISKKVSGYIERARGALEVAAAGKRARGEERVAVEDLHPVEEPAERLLAAADALAGVGVLFLAPKDANQTAIGIAGGLIRVGLVLGGELAAQTVSLLLERGDFMLETLVALAGFLEGGFQAGLGGFGRRSPRAHT